MYQPEVHPFAILSQTSLTQTTINLHQSKVPSVSTETYKPTFNQDVSS